MEAEIVDFPSKVLYPILFNIDRRVDKFWRSSLMLLRLLTCVCVCVCARARERLQARVQRGSARVMQ
jgi:hypothetical protein